MSEQPTDPKALARENARLWALLAEFERAYHHWMEKDPSGVRLQRWRGKLQRLKEKQ